MAVPTSPRPGPRPRPPARRDPCREEQRQLLDVGIGRDSDRAKNAQAAVGAGAAKRKDDLVEERIEPSASPFLDPRLEIGEVGIIIPATQLVVAEELAVAWESIDLIPDLCDCERRAVE